jgi:hypothetical protein
MGAIISASRRTDIPAWYADWFLARVEEGFCDVPHPRAPGRVSRIPLTPEEVALFVFWTKNPAPLEPHLPRLDRRGYRYVFLYTLNAYGREIEPGIPDRAGRIASFRRLAARVGAERVVWRYDPILLSARTGVDWHLEQFSAIARALSGSTSRVIVSLVDFYRKTGPGFREMERRGVQAERTPGERDLGILIGGLAATARACGMEIRSCAEPLERFGVEAGKCIDDVLIRRLFGLTVGPGRDRGQREACRCVPSRDIGVYDTCPGGCLYCYATTDAERARRAAARCDPASGALVRT